MTWTAPEVDRAELVATADERRTLDDYLDHQRQTLRWKCAGLTGAQLVTRPVPSSTLTLLGIVRHLAEVERVWWRARFRGEDVGYLWYTDEWPERDFEDLAPERAPADLATFDEEVALAKAAVAGRPLDEEFVRPGGERVTLRWLYLRMIAEYARHLGHADLIRQELDGRTGD